MGHHFVPKRYLRNFEDSNCPGFLWVHDKRSGKISHAEINHIAQTRDFYSNHTEKLLATKVESPANAVIEKLTKQVQIGPGERAQLAYYIGVMLKRIPAHRRRATEMIPTALSEATGGVREQLRALAREVQASPELLARKLEEVDSIEEKFRRNPPSEVLEQIREPWPSFEVVSALYAMTWRMLVCTGPQFYATTDNPAFFFRAYGLAKNESELSFPLSKTHALHGSYQGQRNGLFFLKATQAMVKEINRRLASEAERLCFYHEPAPWLLTVLRKRRPHLSVIRW